MPWRHFGEVKISFNAFLNSALNDDEWSVSGPRPPYPGESAPWTHFLRRTERNHNSVCWLTILHPISIFVQQSQAWKLVGGEDRGQTDKDGDNITSGWVILWTSCKESEVIQHTSYSILKQLFKILKHFLFCKLWHNKRFYEFQWIATRSL
jgi:hypothetical protein